jgi:hypothetical protein
MFRSKRAAAQAITLTHPDLPFADRRDRHRIHTICRFARVESRGDQGLWRVCNLSDEGMMLRTPRPLSPGEPLTIALSERITVEALVVWSDDVRCGVRFVEPIESTSLLCALATEQRSPEHRPLRLPVDGWALGFDEAGVHAMQVRNVSRRGVGVYHPGCMMRGSALKLMFENGAEHRGIVRWADQERAGLYLLDPFTAEELASAKKF